MKVGQVTYCGNNYGSVLQCYATQAELKTRGFDCVLVTRAETGLGRVLQRLEFWFDRTRKELLYPQYRQVFRECLQTLKPTEADFGLCQQSKQAIDDFICTKIRKESFSWREMSRFAHGDDCAFFLSGSDQIWSAQWFIANRLWFLRFCPRDKRVAWMPSFGGDVLPEYNRTTYAKYISQYAHLSVREEAGSKIINDLLHISVSALGDPVFLLKAEDWRKISAGKTREKPYIMMFFLDKPSPIAVKQAKLLQEKTGCEIVYFSYRYRDCTDEFQAGGPEQFLHMIDHAQAVLTDSFHGCVFSSILNTPFYAFSRNSVIGAKQMGRVKIFLKKLAMSERYIDTESQCLCTIEPIRQDLVQNKLEDMRNQIRCYLDQVLQYYEGKEN